MYEEAEDGLEKLKKYIRTNELVFKKFDEVINLEYAYVKNWSLIEDIQIFINTVQVVIFEKNPT
ncbi:MAG: hypothetical protein WCG23_09110 [bacterium]